MNYLLIAIMLGIIFGLVNVLIKYHKMKTLDNELDKLNLKLSAIDDLKIDKITQALRKSRYEKTTSLTLSNGAKILIEYEIERLSKRCYPVDDDIAGDFECLDEDQNTDWHDDIINKKKYAFAN